MTSKERPEKQVFFVLTIESVTHCVKIEAFIRQLYENKGINHRFPQTVPDLGAVTSNKPEPEGDLTADHSLMRDKECVICMDHQRGITCWHQTNASLSHSLTTDCVLHPCHHLCVCIQCGRLLLKRSDSCPICRRTINNAFRVYHS